MSDTTNNPTPATDRDRLATLTWAREHRHDDGPTGTVAATILATMDYDGPQPLTEWSEDLRGTWVEQVGNGPSVGETPGMIVGPSAFGRSNKVVRVLDVSGAVMRECRLSDLMPRPDLGRVNLYPTPEERVTPSGTTTTSEAVDVPTETADALDAPVDPTAWTIVNDPTAWTIVNDPADIPMGRVIVDASNGDVGITSAYAEEGRTLQVPGFEHRRYRAWTGTSEGPWAVFSKRVTTISEETRRDAADAVRRVREALPGYAGLILYDQTN